jgi:hypothetical protein
VLAANAALKRGATDEQAIFACIAAGKRTVTMSDSVNFSFRLAPNDSPWTPSGDSSTVTINGKQVPRQFFLKAIIRTGDFVKMSEGLAIHIADGDLENWVEQFKRMKANNVDVPIPDTHDNFGKARENMGYVRDLFMSEGTLWMRAEIIGEESIEAALKSDVSIDSPVSFTDGSGNKYRRPIRHVALCTDPVVTGLGSFLPLKFSLQQRTQTMLEFLKKMAAMIGVDPESIVDEAAGQEAVLAALTALLEKKGATNPQETDDPAAAPGGEEGIGGGKTPPSGLSQETTKAPIREQTTTTKYGLSRGEKPNPMVVSTLAENRSLKIDGLVRDGKITKAVADKLRDQFIGKDNAVVSLALSSGSDGKDFESVIAAFAANDPVELKKSAGAQVTLSDNAKGASNEKGLVADAKARQERAKAKVGAK